MAPRRPFESGLLGAWYALELAIPPTRQFQVALPTVGCSEFRTLVVTLITHALLKAAAANGNR